MSSAVSRIVIKSDRRSNDYFQIGQVVRVSGAHGLYVVMDLDRRKRVAQLMEKSGKHRLVEVPFSKIRSFNSRLAQAIHRFLDSK